MKSIIDLHPPIARPIRTVQFGEGNFLRAFIGELWQSANDHGIPLGNIAVVKPRALPEGTDPLSVLRGQQGVYTVLHRGRKEGQIVDEAQIIDCVPEFLYPDRDRAENFLCAGAILCRIQHHGGGNRAYGGGFHRCTGEILSSQAYPAPL